MQTTVPAHDRKSTYGIIIGRVKTQVLNVTLYTTFPTWSSQGSNLSLCVKLANYCLSYGTANEEPNNVTEHKISVKQCKVE